MVVRVEERSFGKVSSSLSTLDTMDFALLFSAPQVRRGIMGAGGRARAGEEAETIFLPPSPNPPFLPSALLTFIFVCSMHADLKEGIGKDSLPKQTNKTKKKLCCRS